jgi:peptidoglycan hydrolase CwlO-like protein
VAVATDTGVTTTITGGLITVLDSSNNPVVPSTPGALAPVAYVTQALSPVTTNVTNLQNTVSDHEARLQAAETELGSITLPTDVTDLAANVSVISGDVTVLKTDVTQLTETLAVAQAELAQGEIGTITSNITNSTGRVVTLETTGGPQGPAGP